MFKSDLIVLFFAFSLCSRHFVAATNSSTVAPVDITDNVLEPIVHKRTPRSWYPRLAPSQHLLFSNHQNQPYVAHVSVAGQLVPLAVKTSAQITWVALSAFTCLDRNNHPQLQTACRLKCLFEPTELQTFLSKRKKSERYYFDDQFIEGKSVPTELHLRGWDEKIPFFKFTPEIVLAEKGFWKGDGLSNGVLGLAVPSLPDPSSVIHTIFEEKPFDKYLVFSLALFRYNPKTPNLAGVLAFGGIPDIPTDKPWIAQHILHRPGSKAPCIEVDDFRIIPSGLDPETRSFVNPNGPWVMAIISGTPKITVPAVILKELLLQFYPVAKYDAKNNLYYVYCDAKSPSFGISMKGRSFYVFKENLLTPAPEYGEGMCTLQLQSASDDKLVLGDPWLRSVVTVFDYNRAGRGQMGEDGKIRIAGQLPSGADEPKGPTEDRKLRSRQTM
ncbi:aspartic peptidase domain-containing protein [Ampelomyces quisqualis]|uniref:Aspartic peptidase domain-containing protein n=1 Tax=Ampelomyces quisqualis TaxID=50730 RepID=A0A6A5QBH7_AMPQU|nr:aspartic peptidase domain-containing protein [Ampelomyces quisqualis]